MSDEEWAKNRRQSLLFKILNLTIVFFPAQYRLWQKAVLISVLVSEFHPEIDLLEQRMDSHLRRILHIKM